MHQIITHFTDDDLYKLTMCVAVIDNFPRTQVRYRFTDRNDTVYPPGFADELRRQIQALESVVISDDEIYYMKRRCRYIPDWFYSYLQGFRYDSDMVAVSQDEQGHLDIAFEGSWSSTILLEVKVLAIVSELYYIMTGKAETFDYGDFSRRTLGKGHRPFYLSMKFDLTPVGTMAHELVCAIAGMYGPQMANHLAMRIWSHTYRGALGTFLYDTYGWRIFSLNFSEDYANMFKGLRVDSGDNYEQLDKIIEKYRSFHIDPRSKQVVFSNALDVDAAIALQHYAEGKCQPSYGIGTHFTNDFKDVRPMNIVIKLTSVKITESWPFYCQTCKMSEDQGKYSGDKDTVDRFRALIHMTD